LYLKIYMEEVWKYFLKNVKEVECKSSVRFVGSHFYRMKDDVRVEGLTRRLLRFCGQEIMKKKGSARLRRSSCETSGMRHGTLVHEQVSLLVNALKKGEKYVSGVDPCVVRAFLRLRSEGMVPCLTEVPCGSEYVGTSVDLVVYDMVREEWALVEMKTGYDSVDYMEPLGVMRWPFTNVGNSLYMRHSLQADAGRVLLNREGLKVPRAYILRMLPRLHGTEWLEVPRFVALERVLNAPSEGGCATTAPSSTCGGERKRRRGW